MSGEIITDGHRKISQLTAVQIAQLTGDGKGHGVSVMCCETDEDWLKSANTSGES